MLDHFVLRSKTSGVSIFFSVVNVCIQNRVLKCTVNMDLLKIFLEKLGGTYPNVHIVYSGVSVNLLCSFVVITVIEGFA